MSHRLHRLLLPPLALLLVALAGCDAASDLNVSPGAAATVAPADASDDVIAGQYIVVLSEQPADAARQASLAAVLADASARAGTEVTHTYEAALTGFAARLSDEAVSALRADARVAYVEPDQMMTIDGSQSPATWGIDRIDQRNRPLNNTYEWNTTGAGINAYIIDTGIRISHNEFGGRASYGYDLYDNDPTASDCNGHGTHVAGTTGGATYGVAKDVNLIAVRVFGCGNSAPTSIIIAGVNWTTANAQLPAVANMSLGGPASSSMDAAVQNLINSGVTVALAAGNGYGANACNQSPARLPDGITIGSTTSSDARSSFSNVGSCIDFFAPGSGITSAWYTGNAATAILSGTSMAAPHVAGVAALYLEDNPSASNLQVRDALYDATTKNIVTGANSANNHLLYSLLGSAPPAGITLSGTAQVLSNGRWRATLDWSGASGSQVDVYANGSRVATTSNDGSWVVTVNPQATNTFDVEVCEQNSSTCSNTITLTF